MYNVSITILTVVDKQIFKVHGPLVLVTVSDLPIVFTSMHGGEKNGHWFDCDQLCTVRLEY